MGRIRLLPKAVRHAYSIQLSKKKAPSADVLLRDIAIFEAKLSARIQALERRQASIDKADTEVLLSLLERIKSNFSEEAIESIEPLVNSIDRCTHDTSQARGLRNALAVYGVEVSSEEGANIALAVFRSKAGNQESYHSLKHGIEGLHLDFARNCATVLIQKTARGCIARSSLRNKHTFAVRLQRFIRGYLQRLKLQLMQRSAVLIQSIARGRIGRQQAREKRLQKQQDEAACHIQKTYRRSIAARRYGEKQRATIKIQSFGRQAQAKQKRRRQAAARKIQAHARGSICRSQKKKHRRATEIQKIYRGHAARKMQR